MSDKINAIIEGEASESDSEDCVTEQKISSVKKLDVEDVPHGVVVVGEAPESDDETVETQSNSSKVEDAQIEIKSSQSNNVTNTNPINSLSDSLLIKKLVECNISMRNNIVDVLKSTVQNGLDHLTDAEKLLVNSQMRVQRANVGIRSFSTNSTLIASKLANSSSYLPNIYIPDEEV